MGRNGHLDKSKANCLDWIEGGFVKKGQKNIRG